MSHKTVNIVCPDWITACVKAKSKLEEERFHPRLLNPTPPPSPPKPPTPEPEAPPPQEVITPKVEPKIEPGTTALHAGTMPLHHISPTTSAQQQHQQQQQHHFGFPPPPHYASPYGIQAGIVTVFVCVCKCSSLIFAWWIPC